MEILDQLWLGASVAFTLQNLISCFLGVLLGTLVGILPGVGPLATISMLLPLSFGMNEPITAIIFMAGIYYGSQYGSSTTAILLKIPGEASSLVTVLDGHEMTRRGRGGAALTIAALASFFAGSVMTLMLGIIGEPLANVAFLFGSADYASLMILGLLASVALTTGSLIKGLGMVLVGMLLATVGTDINSGISRFTFGLPELLDGLSFVLIVIGLFGLSEMIYNLFHEKYGRPQVPSFRELYPTKEEMKNSIWPTIRGTTIGGSLGLLPGAGAILGSVASYVVEKKISKNPQEFGKGAPAGVAGPEAANNAGAQASFIPMLSLGLPTTAVMAVMIAALMIQNIQPGPQVISSNPGLFWGLIVSMWIGNFFLVLLNLPLVGVWVRVLAIPRWVLYPAIVFFCFWGTYSVNNSWFDVTLLIPIALIGYLLKVLECEAAPLAMGFIVGGFFEEQLRRALALSQGDWHIFIQSPLSLCFLSAAVIIVSLSVYFKLRRKND